MHSDSSHCHKWQWHQSCGWLPRRVALVRIYFLYSNDRFNNYRRVEKWSSAVVFTSLVYIRWSPPTILLCTLSATVESARYFVISRSACEIHLVYKDQNLHLTCSQMITVHSSCNSLTSVLWKKSCVYVKHLLACVYATEQHVCCKLGLLYVRKWEMISYCVHWVVCSVCSEQSLDTCTRVLQILLADSVLVSCLSCCWVLSSVSHSVVYFCVLYSNYSSSILHYVPYKCV